MALDSDFWSEHMLPAFSGGRPAAQGLTELHSGLLQTRDRRWELFLLSNQAVTTFLRGQRVRGRISQFPCPPPISEGSHRDIVSVTT